MLRAALLERAAATGGPAQVREEQRANDAARIATPGVDGTYDSLMEQLRSAEVDVVVGAVREPVMTDVEQETLFDDTLAVAARADHPLARRKNLTLRQLRECPWVIPLPESPSRRVFEGAFGRGTEPAGRPAAGEQPDGRVVDPSRQRLPRVPVAAAMGRSLMGGQLGVIPVKLSNTSRKIGLTFRRDGAPSPGMNVFFEQLRLVAAEITA